MTYRALYREWRPQTFGDVVGQAHVVTTLGNALKTETLAHAYLFAGPRGTGKTTLAKLLAKAVNCEQLRGGEPCNECPACTSIAQGRVMDVVEMDAASNRGIDDARSLLEQVRYAPTEVRRKVYIIDEVHMLTTEAFNALLKTLEDPPEQCLFILATTEAHKVPSTIVSRCQRFDFSRLTAAQVVGRLRDVAGAIGATPEDAALWFIARTAGGGMRDALSLFDQTLAFASAAFSVEDVAQMIGGVTSEELGHLFGSLMRGDRADLLSQLQAIWGRGMDASQLVLDMIAYGRDAILFLEGSGAGEWETRAAYDPAFRVLAKHFSTPLWLAAVEALSRLHAELRYQTQASVVVEVTLLALSPPSSANAETANVDAAALRDLQELARRLTARLEQVERRLSQLQAPLAPRAAAPAADDRPGQTAITPMEIVPMAGEASSETEPPRLIPVAAKESGAAQPSGALSAVSERSDAAVLTRLRDEWPALLEALRGKSVHTRAWLSAGSLVAVAGNQAVVVFKSQLHADMVMRPPHKEIIDGLLASHAKRDDLRLSAVLQSDWAARASTHHAGEKSSPEPEAWVRKVIEWFGEDRVTISDEE